MATIKQKRAAKILVEKSGKSSVSAAMKEAGYTQATAKNPSKLTKSKSWPELMEQYLPDKKLAKVHKELLNSYRIDHYVFPLSMTDKEIKDLRESIPGCKLRKIKHGDIQTWAYYWIPDTSSQDAAIDKAYKFKGHYKAEKHDVTFVTPILGDISKKDIHSDPSNTQTE